MKYNKSKSLNGDKVVWIARTRKGSRVVARADSEEELGLLMSGQSMKKVVMEDEESNNDGVKINSNKDDQNESESTENDNSLRHKLFGGKH